jgi:hypothetical protein
MSTAASLLDALRRNLRQLSTASTEDLSLLEPILIERSELLSQWESLPASHRTNQEHARLLTELIQAGKIAEHRIRLARAFTAAELGRLSELGRAQRAFREGLPDTAPGCQLKG